MGFKSKMLACKIFKGNTNMINVNQLECMAGVIDTVCSSTNFPELSNAIAFLMG